MRILAIIALTFAAGTVSATEEKQTPTDAFRGTTQFQILKCQLSTKSALLQVEMGQLENALPVISACLKEGRADVKKVYGPALAKVSKQPAAAKLLKDYYAAWLTAFDGVSPQPSDTKRSYQQRQEAAETRYDEIWNRFEIEAGL